MGVGCVFNDNGCNRAWQRGARSLEERRGHMVWFVRKQLVWPPYLLPGTSPHVHRELPDQTNVTGTSVKTAPSTAAWSDLLTCQTIATVEKINVTNKLLEVLHLAVPTMTWTGGYTTICRLCLQQDGFLLAIFNNHPSQSSIATTEHRSIQKKIAECTGLEVNVIIQLPALQPHVLFIPNLEVMSNMDVIIFHIIQLLKKILLTGCNVTSRRPLSDIQDQSCRCIYPQILCR